MTDKLRTTLTDGSPATPDHRELKPNGQQKGYVVLSEEERAKGWVRPYRESYVHVGVRPKYPTRTLTEEEQEKYRQSGYVLYEKYPPEEEPLVGTFWTEKRLTSGYGAVTTMGRSIAETYASDPKFYSGTFCVHCGAHFPLDEFVWDGTDQQVGS